MPYTRSIRPMTDDERKRSVQREEANSMKNNRINKRIMRDLEEVKGSIVQHSDTGDLFQVTLRKDGWLEVHNLERHIIDYIDREHVSELDFQHIVDGIKYE